MNGDLEEIYCTHKRGLFALALCITGHRAQSEDAVQDAFARLCLGKARPTGNLVNYVFAAVRNAAIDIRRRQARQTVGPKELFEQIEDRPAATALERLEVQEQVRRLQDAILQLEDREQEAVILKTHAGLTFDAIGEITGEPPATVATRYRRALEKLHERLKDVI